MPFQNSRFIAFCVRNSRMFIFIGLAVLVLLTSLTNVPSLRPQGRDSGIFAYTGQVVKEGGAPYRDAWDNKPPLVYLLNAAAFSMFGVNRWAIWIIEIIILAVTSLLFFNLVQTLYKRQWFALFGTLLFIMLMRQPKLIGDGNYTESYALLFQVLCLIFGYQFLQKPAAKWCFWFGLTASLAFMAKQTSAGVAVVFIPALFLTRHEIIRSPRRKTWIVAMGLGTLAGLGVMAIYLAYNQALMEGIEAIFITPSQLHNWISRRNVPIWETVYTSLTNKLVQSLLFPLAPLYLTGAVVAIRSAVRRASDNAESLTLMTFQVWVALCFVLDFVAANITNRAYYHYYITPLPAMTLLILMGLIALSKLHWSHPVHKVIRVGAWSYATLVFISLATLIVSTFVYFERNGDLFGPAIEWRLANYAEAHTDPNDKVLVWGAASGINFQSDRRSPTNLHYAYPLLVPGEISEEYVADLLQDLNENPPEMIIDTTLQDGNRVPPLDPALRHEWWRSGGRRDVENLKPIYDFVDEHCVIVDEIRQAMIYRCQYFQVFEFNAPATREPSF